MAYSPTTHAYGNRHDTGQAYAPGSREGPTASQPSGCGCAEPERAHTCCDLVCFERPEYFCGHLLTDTDLSLDQRYVREKHKLYHRTLHGHGIVCGLRLTCDPVCRGHVLVGEGHGIDDCGNDLVVCEPISFNVVARLREKKLLYGTPRHDDCSPPKAEDDCRIRQCFYVTACYEEEPYEFETPLSPSCGPSPRDCEPSRIRETVRFDVVDRLPKAWSPLEDLQRRVEKCYALFTDGPFADELKKPILQEIADGKATPGERHGEYCEALCRLRELMRLHLERHPDQYHCTLFDDLRTITCPPGPGDEGFQRDTYGGDFRDAVCRIVDLAYQHVMGCVLGELAFPCAEPAKASCLVLGTVEIENDRVVRVCNCPRSYVWSFASFFQVLMATLFGPLACESVEHDRYDREKAPAAAHPDYGRAKRHDEDDCGCGRPYGPKTCCRELKPREGCVDLLRNLAESGRAIAGAGTAAFRTVTSVVRSLQHYLDPTRTDVMQLGALRGSLLDRAQPAFTRKGVETTVRFEPAAEPLKPFDQMIAQLHFAPARGDRIVLEAMRTREGLRIVDARPELLEDRVVRLEQELADLRKRIGEIRPKQTSGEPGAPESGPEGGTGGERPRRRRRQEGQ